MISIMPIKYSLESGLAAMTNGETFKDNPVIVSVAGVLALQRTGHVISDGLVDTLAATLADFGERYGVDSQTIQYALQAAETELCEVQEGRPDTY